MANDGILFVVSSPSGGGKGTILSRVLAEDPLLEYSVSVTTRLPRKGETDAKDYVFVSQKEFRRWVEEGRFLEWAEVHGHRYGTLKESLENRLATGRDVVLELDVQGMRSLKSVRNDVMSIFVLPPSLDELERRLRKRGGIEEEELQLRLANAGEEIDSSGEYDRRIVNDSLEEAVAEFQAVVREARAVRRPQAEARRAPGV